jgi:hypothetical protein
MEQWLTQILLEYGVAQEMSSSNPPAQTIRPLYLRTSITQRCALVLHDSIGKLFSSASIYRRNERTPLLHYIF